MSIQTSQKIHKKCAKKIVEIVTAAITGSRKAAVYALSKGVVPDSFEDKRCADIVNAAYLSAVINDDNRYFTGIITIVETDSLPVLGSLLHDPVDRHMSRELFEDYINTVIHDTKGHVKCSKDSQLLPPKGGSLWGGVK